MAPPAAPEPVDITVPKPRTSRLKRRVGTSAPVETLISNAIMAGVEPETGEEPPLKEFKAIFEASDPKRSGAESFVQESGAFDDDELMLMSSVASQSQTQQPIQDGGKRSTRSGSSAAALRAVPEEEEEESQMPVHPPDVGKKRKERSFDGDDVEMASLEEALNGASGLTSRNGPATKKRAVPGNAVKRAAPKPPSAAQPAANVAKPASTAKGLATTKSTGKKDAAAGAASGKPDTDDAFLKAIASTKRRKKTEDDFDRDFNKLKVLKSKQTEEVDARPEWELLETFCDETNLCGNFMVIHDLEIFKASNRSEKRAGGNDPHWEGKPDLKKFKKNINTNAVRKKGIELIISEENDADGLGPGYWKGGSSLARSEEDFGATQKRRQPAKTEAKSQAMIIDDFDVLAISPSLPELALRDLPALRTGRCAVQSTICKAFPLIFGSKLVTPPRSMLSQHSS
ncbi:hypothetical protein K438DRAFT_1889504, partial [Mycena galopus ATCC 62051]